MILYSVLPNTLLLTAAFMAFSWGAHCRADEPAFETSGTAPRYGLGVSASLASGSGLAFRGHVFSHGGIQLSGISFGHAVDHFGAELFGDFGTSGALHAYLMCGSSYLQLGDSSYLTVGAGIGLEYISEGHPKIGWVAELPYVYVAPFAGSKWDPPLLPFPSVAVIFYF